MSSESGSIDEIPKPVSFLHTQPNTAGYASSQRGSEPRESSRPLNEVEAGTTLIDLRRQVQALSRQLSEERSINKKLIGLNQFSWDHETAPSPERAAQNMAKLLTQLIGCKLVCIFEYHPAEQHYKILATAGDAAPKLPANFSPDLSQRVISLAVHNQSVIFNRDLPETSAGVQIGGQRFTSVIAAPLARNGVLRGLILCGDSNETTFSTSDLPLIECASAQLMNTWEYIDRAETLTEFVQSVAMMSVIQESASLLEMTASIAQQSLHAGCVVVASLNQQDWLIRSVGRAPRLIHSIQNNGASFLEAAMRSPYTFRLRDLRQDDRTASLRIDSDDLRTLLACPIRINGSAAGILLAFGKPGADHFSDADVFLTELLVSQAAVNMESCFLNHELRVSLKTTQLLYDLSQSISRAENLKDAAFAIARTAYRLLQARRCGLILFSSDGRIEAEVHFPNDDHHTAAHPYAMIQQAMDARQTIYLAESENISHTAIPIQTMRRCYGALWLETSDDNEESRHPTEEIRILVNQAAVALERSILIEETRQQASEIVRSYHRLESAYEDLLYGLTKALDARDGETQKHSWRVEDLSVRLGIELGLSRNELQALKRGALLHDIGKIGVRDAILLKHGPLDDGEWQEMRQHPQKGAQIIQEIPALHDALPVIAFHQERWDGSGYPLALKGTDIPLLARLFAVVDVFDALTSDRPYRKSMPVEEALAYLEAQAGHHFDPEVVARFTLMIRSNPKLYSLANHSQPSLLENLTSDSA